MYQTQVSKVYPDCKGSVILTKLRWHKMQLLKWVDVMDIWLTEPLIFEYSMTTFNWWCGLSDVVGKDPHGSSSHSILSDWLELWAFFTKLSMNVSQSVFKNSLTINFFRYATWTILYQRSILTWKLWKIELGLIWTVIA